LVRTLRAYTFGLLGVGLAAALTHFVAPLQSTPTVLFFAAVVVTAWLGHKGPILVTVLLSSAIVDWWFVEPTLSLLTSIADVVRFSVFALVALSIHYLDRRSRRTAKQLRETNVHLEARVRDRTTELESSLREKEVLYRELQHRVKNNLQVITSLLSLQKSRISDESCQQLFQECQSRVRAIAIVHQRLCGSPNGTGVDLTSYFRQLVQELMQCYSVGTGSIQGQVVAEDLALPVDSLIPCALIVNELVCNSLKYAFPDGRQGRVRVELHRRNGEVCLSVADDGIGYSYSGESIPRGIGLQIVDVLVKQLSGSLRWENESGTKVTIAFPHDE
jgi:two-component sensor histidine kinase